MTFIQSVWGDFVKFSIFTVSDCLIGCLTLCVFGGVMLLKAIECSRYLLEMALSECGQLFLLYNIQTDELLDNSTVKILILILQLILP